MRFFNVVSVFRSNKFGNSFSCEKQKVYRKPRRLQCVSIRIQHKSIIYENEYPPKCQLTNAWNQLYHFCSISSLLISNQSPIALTNAFIFDYLRFFLSLSIGSFQQIT